MHHLLRRTAVVLVAAAGSLALAAGPAAAAPNAQDQEFLVGAHQGNLAEIAAGQAALAQATSPQVKEMGQMLVTDHQTLDGQLVPVAQQLGVTLPDAPSASQAAALARVQSLSGAEFDKAWVALQIESHRATLALGEKELAGGAEPSVQALATASAPVVQHHLDMALAAAGALGVPTSVPAGSGGDAAGSTQGIGLAVAGAGLLVLTATALVAVRRRHA
ncbi:DUF4142 domain-containing protein [Cellulomonas sp. 179-A 4D5 NHS]|uniref:DUF4142 domain-containing protein n=1 Tax=Cellulomonas sp. 179-A 4D5 NHS TaxID=3142378 RepID=UPI0039A05442